MPIFTVSQVTNYVKEYLDSDASLADLWVRGEVSNFTRATSGHMYFSIKDEAGQLRCVMFRSGAGGQHLATGKQVVVHGRVSLYEQRGDLQLYADMVQLEGLGKKYLEMELLKARLEKEGLFDPARKRQLPRFPSKVAVITSPTGAVFHDIRQIIGRRFPLVELVLVPAQVQGDAAADSVVRAFETLNLSRGIDIAILARGGGSEEELWSFNEERVVRAIFSSRIPVVSAVGHETNFTLADFVADVRAPTPSAAAELAVPDKEQLQSNISDMARLISGAMEGLLTKQRDELKEARARLVRLSPDVPQERQRIDDLIRTAAASWSAMFGLQNERISGFMRRLGTLSPASTLKRGYSIVSLYPGGSVITSKNQVKPGDAIKVGVADGSFSGQVTAKG